MHDNNRMGNIRSKDRVTITKDKYQEYKKLKEENLELKQKLDEADTLLRIINRPNNPHKYYYSD